MIDFDILKDHGTTNERLREVLSAKLPAKKVLDKMEKSEVKALQKDIDRRNRPADEPDDVESKAPAEPASDWTGSAEEWKQVIDEYRRPVDLGQIFNRKR